MMRIGLLGQIEGVAEGVAACATPWFPSAIAMITQVVNNECERERWLLDFMRHLRLRRVHPGSDHSRPQHAIPM